MGVRIAIASGRYLRSLDMIEERLGIPILKISINGALIVDGERTLNDVRIDREAYREASGYIKGKAPCAIAFSPQEYVIDSDDSWYRIQDGMLSQKGIYDRVYPASTTKILTCLVALEHGDLSDTVTVPEEARITVSGSSMADLKVGDQLSLQDLLYGLMIPSGNDAAAAVAVYIAGSEEAFAEMMNETALRLGATQSHFVNPHGLPDDNHYTTPYDMYLIFQAAMKNPDFRDIIATTSHDAEVLGADGVTMTISWETTNLYI